MTGEHFHIKLVMICPSIGISVLGSGGGREPVLNRHNVRKADRLTIPAGLLIWRSPSARSNKNVRKPP
jgi:hypothetical protein